MQKKFVTNLALLLSLNLLIKPFWILGIDRAVQNVIGAKDYGLYFAIFNFSFLLNILLDVGITNFNNKNIAQNNHLITKHFSNLVVLKFMLAVVYIIATILCGYFIGYDARLIRLLLIMGFNQFLISFIMYLRSNLAGLHLFITDSIISVLDRLIMIAICSALLWGNFLNFEIDVMTYAYAQTFAYLLTAIITFLIVVRRTEFHKLSFSTPFFIMILKRSFPFAVLVLLMAFYNRIDTVMLERLLPDGDEESGIYAQAYRILDATNMIAFLFAGLLLPIFSKMLKHKESVEQLVKLSFILLITPAVVIAVGCCFYNYELMGMLYKEHIESSALVFSVLMCCFCAISTTYIFGTLLTANGNLKELNIMAAGVMILNIVLNLILIPRYHAFGSAVASMITQFLAAGIQVMLVQYNFKFRVNYRLLTILLLFVVGVIGINYFSRMLPYAWVINFSIMVVCCFLWAFITRLLSIKSMVRIMKYG